jgi:outer membrane protein assembly factor BamB
MNKLLIVATGLLAAAAVAPLSAQSPSRRYSDPATPPQDALDRLRLKTAWAVTVPTDGRRDGLVSVQMLPAAAGHELLIQTRSGGLTSLDAATGRMRWSTRVGTPYRAALPAAYNSDTVFVVNNVELYALDRATGRLRWQYDLPTGVVAPPAADDRQIYISLSNGRFLAYALPNLTQPEKLAREPKAPGAAAALEAARVLKGTDVPSIGPLAGVREAYRVPQLGPQPAERWSYVPDQHSEVAPLLAQDAILVPAVDGDIFGLAKSAPKLLWPTIRMQGRIAVPAGQYDETAYVGGSAYNLYAISITTGQVFWRYASGGTPTERPVALDQDVYLSVSHGGLVRLDRASGDEVWRNEDGAHFLAANMKFVYATDPQGRLLVLDRERGTTLSTYACTHDFVFPVQNEWTDRAYLAANSGLIVCLHDRDYEKPLAMKKVQERTPLPPPGGGKPAPKEPAGEGTRPGGPGEGAEKKP